MGNFLALFILKKFLYCWTHSTTRLANSLHFTINTAGKSWRKVHSESSFNKDATLKNFPHLVFPSFVWFTDYPFSSSVADYSRLNFSRFVVLFFSNLINCYSTAILRCVLPQILLLEIVCKYLESFFGKAETVLARPTFPISMIESITYVLHADE